jgi:uncharacterized membrane protein (UPF0127 family)
MAWLVSGARVLASAEVAETRSARRKGLSGRASVDGALVIPDCRWVHTLGMKFPIDVAYLDEGGRVVKVECLKPLRMGSPVKGAHTVVEAEAGAFGRWGLRHGDRVEVRLSDGDPPTGAS